MNRLDTNSQNNFDISIFEIEGGQVNLTKMAKHFDKEVKNWLRLQSTASYVRAYAEAHNRATDQIVTIRKGGSGEQGTWADKQIALKLAQWISPDFEVYCTHKLDELFSTGSTSLQGIPKVVLDWQAMNPAQQGLTYFTEVTKRQQLLEKYQAALPSIEFAQEVAQAANTVDMNTFAKMQGWGVNVMYAALREMRILMTDLYNKDRHNMPYQAYMMYFDISEYTYQRKNGRTYTAFKLTINGKGQIYLAKRLREYANQNQLIVA